MANTSWGDKTAQSAWSRIPGLFRGCLRVLGSPSSTGIVSVLLSTSLNQNWESWGKPLTECFLSSWGMFTEVWCFSKPLIRSTPCLRTFIFLNVWRGHSVFAFCQDSKTFLSLWIPWHPLRVDSMTRALYCTITFRFSKKENPNSMDIPKRRPIKGVEYFEKVKVDGSEGTIHVCLQDS